MQKPLGNRPSHIPSHSLMFSRVASQQARGISRSVYFVLFYNKNKRRAEKGKLAGPFSALAGAA